MDIAGKTLETLKEIVPGLAKVATLAPRQVSDLFSAADNAAAKSLGIEIIYVEMSGAEAADAAMQRAVFAGARGVVLRGTPFYSSASAR